MENNQELIEQWGKPNKKLITRIKHRKILLLSLTGAVVALIIFLIVANATDLIAKPIKSLTFSSSTSDWAMIGHDPAHSGSATSEMASLQGLVTNLFSADNQIHSYPAISQGIIYVGSRDYYLYAIDASNGSVRWKYKAGSYVDSSPIVADGKVYFGSNDGKLYALNAATGQKIWDFKTQYAIRSAVAVVDNRVYFGADDYNVYGLNADTGKQIWSHSTDNAIESSPVIADGIVFIGSQDGNLYALDAKNGRQRLQFPAGSVGSFSPVEVDGTVFVGSSSGWAMGIDGDARNWPGERQIRPNWEALHLYGVLPAAPRVSGFLWSFKLNGTITSSPTLVGNTLIFGMSNKIVGVSTLTHAKIWEYSTGAPVSATPAAVGGKVYAACENGHLYILNVDDGTLVQDIVVGGKLNSIALSSAIYVTSEDGKLFSIK